MTEATLKRYRGIMIDIKRLEQQIQNGKPKLTDIVLDASKFPYDIHAVPVEGTIDADIVQYNRDKRQLDENYKLRDEIRAFISAVPDERVRSAMWYRYIKGLGWQAVATRCEVAHKNTPKNWVKNYLESC